jgi:hypothetical protein
MAASNRASVFARGFATDDCRSASRDTPDAFAKAR